MQELLALLQGAGNFGFRDARGPLGFTQRQRDQLEEPLTDAWRCQAPPALVEDFDRRTEH